jgi:hypothetical protein
MAMRPVTLVENMVSISAGEMDGAWATPLTRPLLSHTTSVVLR